MLIVALLTSWILLPGNLAVTEARPFAPRTSGGVADNFPTRFLVITAQTPDRRSDPDSLPDEKWLECAFDEDSEKDDDPDEESVCPHQSVELPCLRLTDPKVRSHPDRSTRSVPAPKQFFVLRC